MKAFFKTFFAALLALVIFTVLCVFVLIGIIAAASKTEKPFVGNNAVLVLDLSDDFKEQSDNNPVNAIFNKTENDVPSLYDMVRMISHAKSDSSVKGIYILCGTNPNGFGASEELRKALIDFKTSNKFIIAYGETITQKGYYVGSVANKMFCHPQGGIDWAGFVSGMTYIKGALDKLEIQPQIFYAGKFKSATEPLREYKMTDANRLQTSVWLGDLYSRFLEAASESRKIDTATLHSMAIDGIIQTANDALKYGLVDGLKYDDEVKAVLNKKLKEKEEAKINFVSFNDYDKSVDKNNGYGGNKVAIVYASGDIVSGNNNDEVSSDVFRTIFRKLRLDKDVKAIVFRVNSPGGSALASEVIWREVALARKEKPVIVSMGDVAASGGYYISCNADSVFANANTITGSIGVFSVVPNFESFFKSKLGITFDRVKTSPYADMGSGDRPLTETEKRFFQASVDSIYYTFKSRVAAGRKKDAGYIDSIAQGRVWTGARAISVGLVDKTGTLQDAVECAVRMARLSGKEYRIKEYPEKKTFLEQVMNNYKKTIRKDLMKEELGESSVLLLREIRQVKQMVGVPQTRLPFTVNVY